MNAPTRFAILALFSATLVASPAAAQTRSWSGLFTSQGSWSNPVRWNPVGVPAPGESVFIGDQNSSAMVRLDVDATVMNLTLSANAELENIDDADQLTVTDTLSLTGSSLARMVNVETNDLDLTGTSELLVLSSLFAPTPIVKVTGQATIGSTAQLTLQDTAEFEAAAGSGRGLVNNGTIVASGVTRLAAPVGATLDLDGSTGAGVIRTIAATATSNDALTIEGPLSDNFDGLLDIGESTGVRFTTPWQMGSGGELRLTTGVLGGADVTLRGIIEADGISIISADAVVTGGIIRTVAGAGATNLDFDGALSLAGGPASPITIDTVVDADGATTFDGASIVLEAGSQLRLGGGAIVNTATLTGAGAARNSGPVTIDGSLTLDGFGGDTATDGYTSQFDTVQVNGVLTIDGGSAVRAENFSSWNKAPGGTINLVDGLFRLAGGSLAMNSAFSFGSTENPLFEITEGSEATVTTSWIVGDAAGTSGRTVVTGTLGATRSTLRGTSGGAGADLIVGDFGNANLTVSDGGLVNLRDDVIVGRQAGSNAALTVSGVATPFGLDPIRSELDVTSGGANSRIEVGAFGTGALAVLDGGIVRSSGDILAGLSAGGQGFITVGFESEGLASILETDADLRIGVASDGLLTVFNGGIARGRDLRIGPNGAVDVQGGLVEVTGMAKEVGGQLTVTGGVLRFLGGDVEFNSSFAFGGVGAAAPAISVLDGTDATVDFSWTIGQGAGTTGQTTVKGASFDGARQSRLRGTGGGAGADLVIGDAGDGFLFVQNGGLVDLADDTILGQQAGSSGVVVVSGVNTNGGTLNRSHLRANRRGLQSVMVVGSQGDGDLSVLNGGLVEVGNFLQIASANGTTGQVFVQGEEDGFDAELRVGGTIFVGGGGNGAVNLGSGGSIVAGGMTLGATASLNISGGSLELDTLDTTAFGPLTIDAGVIDIETIQGDVTFGEDAVLAPGDSPGLMTINGDADFNGVTIEYELGGLAPAEYDRIRVNGILDLDATAFVSLIDGFMPALGDEFELLDAFGGIFGSLFVSPATLPDLPGDLGWELNPTQGTVVLTVVDTSNMTGDYNGDGRVDAADYTVYRDTLGNSVPNASGADGDGDGVIDEDDYQVWLANFGNEVAGSFALATAVPEPTTGAFALTVVIAGFASTGRRSGGATLRGCNPAAI